MFRFVFILILLTTTLFAGQYDDSSSDSLHREFGSKFDYVFQIEGVYHDNKPFTGSAVAIDHNNILTAAHIVENHKECFVINKDKKKFKLIKVIKHPDFKEENLGFADIAIAYSAESFNLQTYPLLYNHQDEISKACSIAGYGMAGTFSGTKLIFDNKIRGGTNTIDGLDRDMIICSVSKKTDKDYTNLEYLIAPGDSGGGLFIDSKLAGINSCVVVTKNENKIKIKEESGHTRISKFVDWIQKNKQ